MLEYHPNGGESNGKKMETGFALWLTGLRLPQIKVEPRKEPYKEYCPFRKGLHGLPLLLGSNAGVNYADGITGRQKKYGSSRSEGNLRDEHWAQPRSLWNVNCNVQYTDTQERIY